MLDIKFIRENVEIIKEGIRKKRIDFDLDGFLSLDAKRKNLLKETEEARFKQNSLSEKISASTDEIEKKSFLELSRQLKEKLKTIEEEFKIKDSEWKKSMLQIPNVPDPTVPEGASDEDNVEIRKWGEPKKKEGQKDHISIMKYLNMLDLERGAKVSGFRGYFLKNEAALLSMALWRMAMDMLITKGFEPMLAPVMARIENFMGTGWLPQGEEEVYKVQDNLYLAGTAEVPMMGFHANEILNEKDLPKKYVAFSPCFRREAGSYGKDTKGIFRIHEFMKVEQVILCKADHEESVKWHEEITKNAEEIMQALKIPYRVVVNCGADLKLANVKTYDIEAWIPSENKYRETHSSSYFNDFQTRRLNIRYKGLDDKIYFAHSLNNTAIATPRILISLLENYQNPDGTITVPEVLQKYLGKKIIGESASF